MFYLRTVEYPVLRAEKNRLSRMRGVQQRLDPKKHNTLDSSFRLKKHNLKILNFLVFRFVFSPKSMNFLGFAWFSFIFSFEIFSALPFTFLQLYFCSTFIFCLRIRTVSYYFKRYSSASKRCRCIVKKFSGNKLEFDQSRRIYNSRSRGDDKTSRIQS